MATNRFHTLGAIQIPRGMVWVDEFAWSAYERASERSTTGALLLDGAMKKKGRPITLQGQQDAGWINRQPLEQLVALADAALFDTHVLTLADGRVFNVKFAPVELPVSGDPVARPELPVAAYPYVATVRLITV